jgi:hypothetical protein
VRRRFLRKLRVHFPLLAPDTSDGNGVESTSTTSTTRINVAIAELTVVCSGKPANPSAWMNGQWMKHEMVNVRMQDV